jgi:hypothetical protein
MSIAPNQIVLYEHADYTGKTQVIRLDEHRPGVLHSISGTSLNDRASAVRWNLPVGRVVTFTENNGNARLPDLTGLGRTHDLIGNGGSGEIHFGNSDTNDCFSGFFWRDVDLARGHIVFYKDSDYRNIRQTVFLSEWEIDKAHNISGWAIQDRMSSVRWMNLDPRIIVGLYDGTAGGGSAYTNIMRRGPENAYEGVPSLAAYGMQDKVSSFRLIERLPVAEVIDKIEFDRTTFPRKSVTIDAKGSAQGSPLPSSYSANVSTTWHEGSSVTLQQTHRVGGAFSYQYSSGSGAFGKHTFSVTLSYDYTNARSDTASKSEALQITHQETYPIPPNNAWSFKLILRYDQIDVDFTTNATRWYDEPLTLHGSFRFDTNSTFVATPL